MAKPTRAEFLRLGGLAGLLGAAGIPSLETPAQAATADGRNPDLALINARVLTSDDAMPRAEAFAVKNGKFIAVGPTADIRNIISAQTQVIDAGGMTVTPGFIDCHCHPNGVNELYGVNTNLPTKGEIIAALRKRAAQTPPGYWVSGFMYDDTKVKDGAVTIHDLDQVSKEHPVVIGHRGGHTSVYNSKAFEIADVNLATKDPSDGRFNRDSNGQFTGTVSELARRVFDKAGKREEFTPAEQRKRGQAGMAHISGLLTSVGLTSVHHTGADRDQMLAYMDARQAGELKHRAYILVTPDVFTGLKSAGVYTGLGDEWVRVGGVKFFADGSASERTMYMSTPYEGTNDHGIRTMTQEELYEAVDDAHSHDFQIGIHANGDLAIESVLNAYERALKKWPHPDRRHRIEHCSLVNPAILQRIKENGVIPTPFWTYVYYHGEKWKAYGEEKMKWMFAHRSFLDYGIRVPGASDYTPGPFEPMMAIQSMVTRKDYAGRVWGANQKVTVDEALKIATIHGAYPSYEEHTKGSITAGKLADFVILEKDPHQVDPDTIKDIKIVRTVVGGRTVHPKSEA
jgi:predicted amidohydrolase YtcJ